MKPTPTKPAKTVVQRSPEEHLARVDAAIEAATAGVRKLKVVSAAALIGGLGACAAITAAFWVFTDYLVIWGLPAILIGGGLAGYCAKETGALGNQLIALNRERRELQKSIPGTPYGHARPESP